MTRRELLAASLAAGTLWAKSSVDRSRISPITDEVATSPEAAIAFAKEYGLSYVELRGVPGRKTSYAGLPEAELKQANKELADNGLKVSFLNTGLLKIPLPGTEPVRRRQESAEARAKRAAADQRAFDRRLEDLRHAIQAAHIFGVDKVRVFAFHRTANPAAIFPRIADIIGEMAEIAGRERIHLLIENESSCNVATCAETVDILKRLPSKWVGINWDPLNGTSQKENPFPDGYKMLPKERLGNIQMKGKSLLDDAQKLDWASIFQATANDGYKGRFGLETHYFDGTLIEKSHASMREILRILSS